MKGQEMLTLEACRQMATTYLAGFKDVALYHAPLHEGAYGWVFGYQSRAYIQSGKLADALIGNAPVLIDRHSHELHVLGTGLPIEYYVENYQNYGDPFKASGKSVELHGWQSGAQKVAAIRAIRSPTALSICDAKLAVETCLEGKASVVECRWKDDAERLAACLDALGFCVKQLGE